MQISIDVSDQLPVFSQLIQQIKQSVLDGSLRPGAPLPTIRQLASDLQLNHNTVAKAYRRLERDVVIETLGRRGTFIHKYAKRNCQVDLNFSARCALTETVSSLRESGLTDSEIRNAFLSVMNERNNTNNEEN